MDQFWGCGWIFRYFGPRCPRRQTARPAYQHFWPHSNWPPIRLDSFCSWESELQIYCHSRDLFLENGCKPNQEYYVWFHVWLRCSDRTPFWNQCCMIAWLQSMKCTTTKFTNIWSLYAENRLPGGWLASILDETREQWFRSPPLTHNSYLLPPYYVKGALYLIPYGGDSSNPIPL